MVALQISPKKSLCMDWVDRPQKYKEGSNLDNFPLKTLKLGWVAFYSLTFQLKFLDFHSNQYKKLAPVLSRFYNGQCFLCVSLHAVPPYFATKLLLSSNNAQVAFLGNG